MKFVQQRETGDCGIASVAMYLDVSYEYAAKLLAKVGNKKEYGLSIHSILAMLSLTDIEAIRLPKPLYYVDAIILLPSLNKENSSHYIVYSGDDNKIFDPNKGRSGKKYYDGTWQCLPQMNQIIVNSNLSVVQKFIRSKILYYKAYENKKES